jgi:uncharacterized membrane protein
MTALEQTKTVLAPAPVTTPAATPARSVVAIEFPDVFRAHEAMLAAARLERRLSVVLNDAAVVTRNAAGKVRVNRGGRPSPLATGSWAAAAVGVPGFLLFGIWVALAVSAATATGAAIWAKRAVGLRPSYLRGIGAQLTPGRAAGCFLVSHGHLTHVLAEARRFDGWLIHSTLPEAMHAELAGALASD